MEIKQDYAVVMLIGILFEEDSMIKAPYKNSKRYYQLQINEKGFNISWID